jgi:aryl-alcohol dehydrogenase-like predicted oxidoreductase
VIEEVAGAVKDLIKAGRVRQFGMSEAAAGTIRQPKERCAPSDQQADGDVDTAAPTQAARRG